MKKMLGYLICGAILICSYQGYAQNTSVSGDINGDKSLTLADAVLGLQVLVFSDIRYEIDLNADLGNEKRF